MKGQTLDQGVYLSVGGPTMLRQDVSAHVHAQWLNKAGASVFIDEAYILDRLGADGYPPQVLAALCHADELVVLFPEERDFPHRDYLVIALALAEVRRIPITILLPSGTNKDSALRVVGIPPFLDRGKFVEHADWDEHYATRNQATEVPPPEVPPGPIRLTAGPRVCLVLARGAGTSPAPGEQRSLAAFVRALSDAGFRVHPRPDIEWIRRRGVWNTPDVPGQPADRSREFDAVVICVTEPRGLWDWSPFLACLLPFERARRPLWVVHLVADATSASLPKFIAPGQEIEFPTDLHRGNFQRLVHGLIGFRDYRSGDTTPDVLFGKDGRANRIFLPRNFGGRISRPPNSGGRS